MSEISHRFCTRLQLVIGLLLAALALTFTAATAKRASAGELEKLDTSLNFVPDDIAFYHAKFRAGEQIQAIAKSKAWRKLMQLPWVQAGLTVYRLQTLNEESPPGMFEKFRKDPKNRQLLAALGDMGAHEIFIVGGSDYAEFLDLIGQIQSAARFGELEALVDHESAKANPQQAQRRAVLEAIVANADQLKAPSTLIGFRVKDQEGAKKLLAELESRLGDLLQSVAGNQEHLSHKTVDGVDYLVLTLEGSEVPWEALFGEKLDEALDGETKNHLIEALNKIHVEVAAGLREDYLILSIGSSLALVDRLGEGTPLAKRPEMRRLEPFAAKPLLSVSFMNGDFIAAANHAEDEVDRAVELANKAVENADLPEGLPERIKADVSELRDELAKHFPEYGSVVGASFSTDAGIENYAFDWTKYPDAAEARPLTLLRHIGERPLLAGVGVGKPTVENYDLLVHWLEKGWGYFEEFGMPQIPESDRGKLERFVTAAKPILAEMNRVNRESLIPALADGQFGYVIDADLKSKQYFSAMPPAEKELPMIEPALLVGVSDAEKLREAVTSHHESVEKLIAAAREVSPDEFPESIKLPAAEIDETSSGTICHYALPKEPGIDEQIAPSFALTHDVAVICGSPAQAKRLLASSHKELPGVLANAKRPRTGAGLVDFPALIEAARPWVDYGIAQSAAEPPTGNANDVGRNVHPLLDVLKALRFVTVEMYIDDDVRVAHSLVEIRDIE